MSKVKRFGAKTKRQCDGNIPFNQAATFPDGVRMARNRDYYGDRSPLPFECNAQLGVTGSVK
jgi:hypothetical protein